jgi:DNA-binding transcriptional LysR family regulator
MKWLAALALSAILHPAIRVRDIEGVERQPLKVEKGRLEALFFISRDCPISNRYSPEIRRICEEYSPRGLNCALVYVDKDLRDADAAKHALEYGHGAYPKFVDQAHALVAAAGATVTPEVVLIRPDESIAYRGRIDNSYAALGKPRSVVTDHDLRAALDAVLAGRPVAKAEVPPIGCYIP